QGGAGASSMAPTRAALSAATPSGAMVLTEARREGLFLFDGSNLSGAVAADPRQGIHITPATDPTRASRAWVRKYPGPVHGQWVRGGAVDGSSLGCRGDRNPHPVEQHVGDQHSRPVAVEQRFRIHSPQPRAVRRLQRIE